MLFTSYAFIAFIAVAFFLYYRIPRKWQWPFLLIISIGFYVSAGIFYPIFLLVSSAVTHLAGLWVGRNLHPGKCRPVCIAAGEKGV